MQKTKYLKGIKKSVVFACDMASTGHGIPEKSRLLQFHFPVMESHGI